MDNKYGALVARAAEMTDAAFSEKLTAVTRLNTADIEDILAETGVDKETMAEILAEIEKAWMYNEEESEALLQISKSISVMVALLKKLL